MLEFLQWLKENKFHQYKDGTWYTTNERPYINGKQRKYYTDEELSVFYYLDKRNYNTKWTKEDYIQAEKMSIRIIYYEETTDNWGRKEASTNPSVIHSVLTTPENFNGDMSFESSNGNIYDIDELIGKEVIVDGFDKFIVTE